MTVCIDCADTGELNADDTGTFMSVCRCQVVEREMRIARQHAAVLQPLWDAILDAPDPVDSPPVRHRFTVIQGGRNEPR